MKIPFNKTTLIGNEIEYLKEVIDSGYLHGDGPFTHKCHKLLEEKFVTKKALLTPSCTLALEMSYILCNFQPGDEVIMPSFAFVSAASSLMIHGAKPIFVDIREDTLNIDENKIEEAITPKTKAILIVHYAGVSCEMDKIMEIAKKHNLFVIEDAAQAVDSKYKGKFLGTIGDVGCFSFHGTKNVVCGEGGAIFINNPELIDRAEIVWEKGTNRKKFIRGEVDKYTWVDLGSSYVMADLLAAFLYYQLKNVDEITNRRKEIYDYYYQNLAGLEKEGLIKLPTIPSECKSNYHLFYIILPSNEIRNETLKKLKEVGIQATFHFVPLHDSPMGQKLGYEKGNLPTTEKISSCLLRLPFYNSINRDEQDYIIKNLKEILRSSH